MPANCVVQLPEGILCPAEVFDNSLLPGGTSVRKQAAKKTRSHTEVFWLGVGADAASSHRYPQASGFSSEVSGSIAPVWERCMMRPGKRGAWLLAYRSPWTMVRSRPTWTCFSPTGDTWPTSASWSGVDGCQPISFKASPFELAGWCLLFLRDRLIATSTSRIAPSRAFSHFNSSFKHAHSVSATIGEKKDIAVRKRVRATRI